MTEIRKDINFNDPKVQRSLTEGFIRHVLKDQVKEGIFKPGEYILFHQADVVLASQSRDLIDDAKKQIREPSDIIYVDKHKIIINPEPEEKK